MTQYKAIIKLPNNKQKIVTVEAYNMADAWDKAERIASNLGGYVIHVYPANDNSL